MKQKERNVNGKRKKIKIDLLWLCCNLFFRCKKKLGIHDKFRRKLINAISLINKIKIKFKLVVELKK